MGFANFLCAILTAHKHPALVTQIPIYIFALLLRCFHSRVSPIPSILAPIFRSTIFPSAPNWPHRLRRKDKTRHTHGDASLCHTMPPPTKAAVISALPTAGSCRPSSFRPFSCCQSTGAAFSRRFPAEADAPLSFQPKKTFSRTLKNARLAFHECCLFHIGLKHSEICAKIKLKFQS